jgi:hypothetical protein
MWVGPQSPPLPVALPSQVVEAYNADPSVHGILVQLPLPKHINETRVLDAISLEKDVDGFHPANIGALAMRGRTPLFVPCTPKVGCPCRRAHHAYRTGGSLLAMPCAWWLAFSCCTQRSISPVYPPASHPLAPPPGLH